MTTPLTAHDYKVWRIRIAIELLRGFTRPCWTVSCDETNQPTKRFLRVTVTDADKLAHELKASRELGALISKDASTDERNAVELKILCAMLYNAARTYATEGEAYWNTETVFPPIPEV